MIEGNPFINSRETFTEMAECYNPLFESKAALLEGMNSWSEVYHIEIGHEEPKPEERTADQNFAYNLAHKIFDQLQEKIPHGIFEDELEFSYVREVVNGVKAGSGTLSVYSVPRGLQSKQLKTNWCFATLDDPSRIAPPRMEDAIAEHLTGRIAEELLANEEALTKKLSNAMLEEVLEMAPAEQTEVMDKISQYLKKTENAAHLNVSLDINTNIKLAREA